MLQFKPFQPVSQVQFGLTLALQRLVAQYVGLVQQSDV